MKRFGPSYSKRDFCIEAERSYYQQKWPMQARPYAHLKRYIDCLGFAGHFQARSVLEIGAGESQYARLFANELDSKVTCALELFWERMCPAALVNHNPRLKFIAGSCYELPFKDGSFEVVFGNGVLHHLPQLQKAVLEIYRILAPGGFYIGIEPNIFNFIVSLGFFANRSANEYALSPSLLRREFENSRFGASTGFFWSRFPWLKNRFLTTCVWILARKDDSPKI